MDLLQEYGGSTDEDAEQDTGIRSSMVVNAAPAVALDLAQQEADSQYMQPTTKMVQYNPTADQMWAPLMGPRNPQADPGAVLGATKNTLLGFVETEHMHDAAFHENYHTYATMGYAPNISTMGDAGAKPLVGDMSKAVAMGGASHTDVGYQLQAAYRSSDAAKAIRNKRKEVEDPSKVDDFTGPWTALPTDIVTPEEPTEEQKEYAEKQAAAKASKRSKPEQVADVPEVSVFSGKWEQDYKGRSWIEAPPDMKVEPAERGYVPKKLIHTWSGHEKGVSAIRWFPKTGHLLLSSCMDGTVKIWGVDHGNRRCLRTYVGHTETVRDICFNSDGTRFLTASHDKWIKLWDTESGKCISKHTTKKIPYCVKFNPNKESECLVGQSNKKVVQWDLSGDEVMQEYDEHMGPINTITFVDENRRFITTSDDKKVFVWEYGIPVVIKHIAEPEMHSMPSVAVHPNNKWWLGQSQDNQILCYSAMRGFKLNKKKRFMGHHNAGFACQISFSPDGQFVCSGDGNGYVYFWDWAKSKQLKRIKAHDKVCIGANWHPTHASRVATCSWDGLIKYWD